MARVVSGTPIVLEVGRRRTFATAIGWPGWSRSGKTPETAIENLERYAPRYRAVVRRAGLKLPTTTVDDMTIVEELEGDASTEFGIPAQVTKQDRRRMSKADGLRQVTILEASWACLDRTAATSPSILVKGPRGGGRDRDKMLVHVLEAETAYARKIGLKLEQPALNHRAAVLEHRRAIAERLRRSSDGKPMADNGWTLHYAIRRFTWHALDHAWEMEDRAVSPGARERPLPVPARRRR